MKKHDKMLKFYKSSYLARAGEKNFILGEASRGDRVLLLSAVALLQQTWENAEKK